MARRATKLQLVIAVLCLQPAGILLLVWIGTNALHLHEMLHLSKDSIVRIIPEGFEFGHVTFVPDRRPPAALRKPASMTAHGELYDDDHELAAHYQVTTHFLIPYWLPIGLLLIFPITLLARRIYRTKLEALRKRSGLCIACGYNIALTPTRCPECGMVPSGE